MRAPRRPAYTRSMKLPGAVITPADAGYDEARAVYNAAHDKRPAAVVRAASPDDVVATIAYSRAHDLPLAVRGGGHGIAGFGTCDGGIVLDLGPMRGVTVDAHARTATVGGGSTWADVNAATHAAGLATTGGIQSTTGVAGLTLGGGLGFLARRFGLACDNLLGAEVVTADGRRVTVDADHEPDLFWALRGGGGNFGVVTSFRFRLHPVSDVLGGLTCYPLDRDVLAALRDLTTGAEAELGIIPGVALGPPAPLLPERWHGRPIAIAVTCYSGASEHDDDVRKRLHGAGPIVGQFLERMPYPAVNTLFDAALPAGLHHYWKGRFGGLPDDALDVHVTYGQTLPCLQTATLLFPVDGAVHRVDPTATAFAVRDAPFASVYGASWPDAADSTANVAWSRAYDRALAPYGDTAGYVNFLSVDDADRIPVSYRQNYARLREVKRAYDPENVFRINQNIPPAG
jgi:FAD/FMN-containing dehydrogenase